MSVTEALIRDAARTKWGIAAFQVVAGLLVIWATRENSLNAAGFVVLMSSIVLGIGLAMHVAVARWLALGLCFLYVLVAILLPPLMFLLRPVTSADGSALRINLLFTAAALGFGGIGYVGLSYFRSDLGRFEYRRDRSSPDVPPGENSAHLLFSAGAWVSFLLLMGAFGLSMPAWLLKPLNANGMPSSARPAPAPAPGLGPDLVARGLCRRTGELLFVVYDNRGQSAPAKEFKIRYSGPWYDSSRVETSTGKLPAPHEPGFAALGNLGRFANVDDINDENMLHVELDADDDIRETIESNNRAEYRIGWQQFNMLSFCDQL